MGLFFFLGYLLFMYWKATNFYVVMKVFIGTESFVFGH